MTIVDKISENITHRSWENIKKIIEKIAHNVDNILKISLTNVVKICEPCSLNTLKRLFIVLVARGAWVMVEASDCKGRCTLEQVLSFICTL